MASIVKVVGQEQAFTSANSFSSAASNQVAGWNVVRVVNVSNSTPAVITINSSPTANLTVLPLGELFLEKASNTTITASSANLLGVQVAYKNN